MKTRSVCNLLLVLVCLLPAFTGNAQAIAPITSATDNGYYRILLGSDIAARANPRFTNLRILDKASKEVPFLLRWPVDSTVRSAYYSYSFQVQNEERNQVLTIDNKKKDRLEGFLMRIGNANASRSIRISGSHDGQHWFVVRDSFTINTNNQPEIALTFAQNNYAFYRLLLTLKPGELPLDIQGVGRYDNTVQMTPMQEIKNYSFSREEKAKSSILFIRCNPANYISRLEFVVASPAKFRREVLIRNPVLTRESQASAWTRSTKRNVVIGDDVIGRAIISSDNLEIDLRLFLSERKADSLVVEILNEDNAPLTIQGFRLWQQNPVLIAEMKQGDAYRLYIGPDSMSAPHYDLDYFEDEISIKPKSLTTGVIQLSLTEAIEEREQSASPKYLVWFGIGVVGIVVLILTLNIARNMRKEEH